MTFWLILNIKFTPFLPPSCLVRDCFALKWLNPALREITLPFLVSFSLFEYDLFVFIPFIFLFDIIFYVILFFLLLSSSPSDPFYKHLIFCSSPLLSEEFCLNALLKISHPYILRGLKGKVQL